MNLPQAGSFSTDSGVGEGQHRTARAVAIILNWNLPDDTIACVGSLRASHGVRPYIQVIDNGSNTDAYDRLRAGLAVWPDVSLMRLSENRGFAAGCNVGIEAALAREPDYVLLLNNDTVAAPDMLAHLLNIAARRPEYGILAPAIYYYDRPDLLWSAGARRRSLPFAHNLKADDLTSRTGGDVAPDVVDVDYVTGCCMLLRPSTLQHVGTFDERYFMYYEDNDLCERTRRTGWRIGVVPEARLWHRVARSTRADPRLGVRLRTMSRVRYYRSLSSRWQRWTAETWLAMGTVFVATHDILHGRVTVARQRVEGLIAGFRDGSA